VSSGIDTFKSVRALGKAFNGISPTLSGETGSNKWPEVVEVIVKTTQVQVSLLAQTRLKVEVANVFI